MMAGAIRSRRCAIWQHAEGWLALLRTHVHGLLQSPLQSLVQSLVRVPDCRIHRARLVLGVSQATTGAICRFIQCAS